MLRALIHNWWLLALRGALALLFALFVFGAHAGGFSSLLRAMAATSVVLLFGVFAFVAGLVTIAASIRGWEPGHSERWVLLFAGLVTCVAGLLSLTLPDLSFFGFTRVLAAWAILSGVGELWVAIRLRRHIADEWFLSLASVAAIAFGAYLLLGLARSQDALMAWIGSYATFSAMAMFALAFRLHKLAAEVHDSTG